MSGYPDKAKRENVRRYLLTEEGRASSDTAAAKECGVSRQLVASVRRRMIVAGEHPAAREVHSLGMFRYRTGSSARGGYVYDERGRAVQRVEWLRRKKKK